MQEFAIRIVQAVSLLVLLSGLGHCIGDLAKGADRDLGFALSVVGAICIGLGQLAIRSNRKRNGSTRPRIACAECGEMVIANARKCRFCGADRSVLQ